MTPGQDIVRAIDLPLEELAAVLDALVECLGLRILRNQAPDYTIYKMEPTVDADENGSPR